MAPSRAAPLRFISCDGVTEACLALVGQAPAVGRVRGRRCSGAGYLNLLRALRRRRARANWQRSLGTVTSRCVVTGSARAH